MSRRRRDTEAPLADHLEATLPMTLSLSDGEATESSTLQNPPHHHVSKKHFQLGKNIAKMNDPLKGCAHQAVECIAKRVAEEYTLGRQEDLFVKAARVLSASNSNLWPMIEPSLTRDELNALKYEGNTGFWDQPSPLLATFLMLFLAAVTQGWSQTGPNGANLGLSVAFGWSPDEPGSPAHKNETTHTDENCVPTGIDGWKFAAVNAAPYLVAGIACWFSDPLNELFVGRRAVIAFSAVIIVASAIGSAFTEGNWKLFLLCRSLLGIGMGCKASVVPVFAAETAPAHLRGTLVVNWQVFDAFGIFLGFVANLIASSAEHEAWRWQVASACIPAFALLWGTIFVSWDSPRFLMKNERKNRRKYDKAVKLWSQRKRSLGKQRSQKLLAIPTSLYCSTLLPPIVRRFVRPSASGPYESRAWKTLLLLRKHPILAAKELLFAHLQLLLELQATRPVLKRAELEEDMNFSLENQSNWFNRVGHLFARRKSRFRYIRRQAVAAGCVMLSQQLCGINVLMFYSSTLVCNTGSGKESSASFTPLAVSCGLGFTNFLFAFPAYRWIESRGRTWLLLATLPLLAGLAAVAAGASAVSLEEHRAIHTDLVIAITFIFTAVYSVGIGPVPFTYSAEVFPLEHRMVGMSFAVSMNLLGAGLLALFVPKILHQWILLTVFAGLNMLAFCTVLLLAPETVGASESDGRTRMVGLDLEQLFYIFRPDWYLYLGYIQKKYWGYFWRSIRNIILWWKPKYELDTPWYIWVQDSKNFSSHLEEPESEDLEDMTA